MKTVPFLTENSYDFTIRGIVYFFNEKSECLINKENDVEKRRRLVGAAKHEIVLELSGNAYTTFANSLMTQHSNVQRTPVRWWSGMYIYL